MGKKKNKKLRRMLRAQAMTQSAQVATPVAAQNISSSAVGEISPTPIASEAPAVSKREAELTQISEDKKDVRHEIRKILTTVVVLVLIIVAVDLINNKTDFILKIGQIFAEKLHLSL